MNRRPPAIFVGDALGLDFLNSIATPVDTAIDWIEDGEGYLSWLEQAHLVPGDVLRDMRTRTLPGELDRVADQARSLREWFRGFVRQHKGRPLTVEALAELEPLNRRLNAEFKHWLRSSDSNSFRGQRTALRASGRASMAPP